MSTAQTTHPTSFRETRTTAKTNPPLRQYTNSYPQHQLNGRQRGEAKPKRYGVTMARLQGGLPSRSLQRRPVPPRPLSPFTKISTIFANAHSLPHANKDKTEDGASASPGSSHRAAQVEQRQPRLDLKQISKRVLVQQNRRFYCSCCMYGRDSLEQASAPRALFHPVLKNRLHRPCSCAESGVHLLRLPTRSREFDAQQQPSTNPHLPFKVSTVSRETPKLPRKEIGSTICPTNLPSKTLLTQTTKTNRACRVHTNLLYPLRHW